MAIDKASILMSEEELKKLKKAEETFSKILEEGDLTKLAQADVEFHEIIYQSSGNKRLIQILNNLREVIYRYRIEYLKDESTREELAREHEMIYKAFLEKDPVRAKQVTYSHIENQRKAIMKSIEKNKSLKES
jgi:DNA-binding GntR family transcriptional regulator